ncbi:Protein ETR-1 g [Aphelenchoides avenae]|nr:Protein ETR-1 g [Aphelenchus avenae]
MESTEAKPGTTQEPDADTIKMFVGQIPRHWGESECRTLFEEFGPVHQLNVLRDKATNASKGCCFVTFYHRQDAINAQNALHNIKTLPEMNHPVQMKPADSENRNERKLFVGMLSKTMSEDDVRTMFKEFGPIEECTVLRDDGRSRGCAFVTFVNRSCAHQAIKQMHHSQTLEGCSKPMVVKFADTQKDKENKKAVAVGTVSPLGNNTAIVQQLLGAQSAATNNNSVTTQLLGLGVLLQQPAILSLLGNAGVSQASIQQQQQLLLQQQQQQQLLALMKQQNAFKESGISPMLFPAGAPMGMPGQHPVVSAHMPSSVAVSAAAGYGGHPQAELIQQAYGGVPHFQNPRDIFSQLGGVPQMAPSAISPSLVAGSNFYSVSPPAASHPGMPPHQNGGSTTPNATTSGQSKGPDGCNLFIYHLPQDYGDQDLHVLFSHFGNVLSAKVFVDKQTNLSKCFGFVSYDNPTSAQSAINGMNGFQIGSKRLKVQLKRSKDKPYQQP